MRSRGSPSGLAGNGLLGIPAMEVCPPLAFSLLPRAGYFCPSLSSYKTISWREPKVNKGTTHTVSGIMIGQGEDFYSLQKWTVG